MGQIVCDIFWCLVYEGPRDFVFIVLFIRVGLLVCFLKFTNCSEAMKDCVVGAFFLSIFGWLCYCF